MTDLCAKTGQAWVDGGVIDLEDEDGGWYPHIHGEQCREDVDGEPVHRPTTCDPRLDRALDQLRDALVNEGPNPSLHRSIIRRHRSEAPEIWKGIEAVMEAFYGPVVARRARG